MTVIEWLHGLQTPSGHLSILPKMSIEDYAARQRAEAAAKAKRLAQKQSDRAQFFMPRTAASPDGGVFSAGESTQPATTGSNGPIRAGQPTPVLRAGGMVQYDVPSRSEPEEPLNPVQPRGDVAILARKKRPDGLYQFWLGGLTISPKLIIDAIPGEPGATLELLGPGLKDWVVALKWGQRATATIAMRYGKQNRDAGREDWTLTSPVCDYLSYYGQGWWSSGALNYRWGTFAEQTSTPFPDIGARAPGFGELVESGYHLPSGGDVTYKLEYWENIAIVGPATATAYGYRQQQGFDPAAGFLPGFPYSYTGTNRLFEDTRVQNDWIGEAQGPGSLENPEGGDSCVLGGPVLTGVAKRPKFVDQFRQTTEIRLETQSYSFSAYRGEIQASVGSHNMLKTLSYEQIPRSGGGRKQFGYRAACREYDSPPVYIWSIRGDGTSEVWPIVPTVINQSNNPLSAAYSNVLAISPTLTKTYRFNAINADQNNGTATTDYYFPRALIAAGDGISYNKSSQSGAATIAATYGSQPHFDAADTTYKSFLIYKGQEVELTSGLNTYRSVWRDLPASPYPIRFEVEFPPYPRLPNGNLDLDALDIFKRNIRFIINKYTGNIANQKLAFNKQVEPKKRIAFSMKSLGSVNTSVVDIKYWAKS